MEWKGKERMGQEWIGKQRRGISGRDRRGWERKGEEWNGVHGLAGFGKVG